MQICFCDLVSHLCPIVLALAVAVIFFANLQVRVGLAAQFSPPAFQVAVESKDSYFFNTDTNSETVSPAERIRLRKVPLATSLWSGTDNVATCPSLIRMIWLPLV